MDLDGVDLADPELDQHFLWSPSKLAILVEAAGIRPTDDVVEIGAGIGSVARMLPRSASLTLVELDERFADPLRRNVPGATVVIADALAVLPGMPCDVLISNMPREVTARLLRVLPTLAVRAAVVATQEDPDLSNVSTKFQVEVLTAITGDDFRPPQAAVSLLVKLSR